VFQPQLEIFFVAVPDGVLDELVNDDADAFAEPTIIERRPREEITELADLIDVQPKRAKPKLYESFLGSTLLRCYVHATPSHAARAQYSWIDPRTARRSTRELCPTNTHS
jgi:hypothetical protein